MIAAQAFDNLASLGGFNAIALMSSLGSDLLVDRGGNWTQFHRRLRRQVILIWSWYEIGRQSAPLHVARGEG
jgi:hypothetical protein